MSGKSIIHIYTDGGSRGNPGPSAIGVYITDSEGKKITGFGKSLGISTNNIAEYTAVIAALDYMYNHRDKFPGNLTIHFFMDSTLVCSQLNGRFKIKHPNMKKLYAMVQDKVALLDSTIHYSYIPREKNKIADHYVNLTLDKIS